MKKTIYFNDFVEEFVVCNRKDQFSHNGLKALYDWLEEELPNFELDVISLCSEFAEYNNIEEIKNDYNIKSLNELHDHTAVIQFNGGIIIQNF
jgi:hypothetical protein